MAQIFGIEEVEFDKLPDELKVSLKAADAANKASEARLTALEAKLNGEDNEGKTKTNEPTAKRFPDVDAGTEMLLQNRCDMILMRLINDKDLVTATAVKLFESEIRDNLELSHPTARAQEPFVRNVIDMVKGRHMTEIIADMNKAPGDRKYGSFFVEGTSGGNNNGSPKKNLADRLDAEQKKAADSFEMSYEDFAKELESMGALGA